MNVSDEQRQFSATFVVAGANTQSLCGLLSIHTEYLFVSKLNNAYITS